jgi:hypothetical protein
MLISKAWCARDSHAPRTVFPRLFRSCVCFLNTEGNGCRHNTAKVMVEHSLFQMH